METLVIFQKNYSLSCYFFISVQYRGLFFITNLYKRHALNCQVSNLLADYLCLTFFCPIFILHKYIKIFQIVVSKAHIYATV